MDNGNRTRILNCYSYVISKSIRSFVSDSELSVLGQIFEHSLGFGNLFFEKKKLFTGSENYGILPITCITSLPSAYRALSSLEKKNFIFAVSNKSYGVNFPAIARAVAEMWKGADFLKPHLSIIDDVSCWLNNNGYEYPRHLNLEEGSMDNVQKVLDVARDKTKQANKKKIEKIKKKQKLNATNMKLLLADICKEVGQFYNEEEWTGKQYKSLKTYTEYCAKADILPYDKFYPICKYWDRLKSSMTTDEGKQIILRDSVSFWQIFQFRREIGSKLAANKEQWEKDYGEDWNDPVESITVEEWLNSGTGGR